MDDSHAAAWYALTMTAMLLQNSDLLALVNDACGSGSTDPWNFTYTFCWLPTVPNGTLGALPAQTPPSQKVIDAVVKNVAPVANYVHILLDIAANDVNFKDTFPAAALSDSWVGWNEWHDYRVTTADLYLFKSMAETAGGLITAVQAWNFQVDIANFVNGLNNDCQAIHSLLDHYPSFFTLLDSSRITNAKDLARTALLDYRQFLNLSALDTGSPNQALFWMSLEDIQRALQDNAQALSSLDSPVTINLWDPPDWTELTGRMYAGAFFAQPWDRKALPAFVQDQYNCTPDADFTGLGDHSMHGVFPGWSAADLTRLYHWMLYNYFGIWWNAPY